MTWQYGSCGKRIRNKVISCGWNFSRLYVGVEYDRTWCGILLYLGPLWLSYRTWKPR